MQPMLCLIIPLGGGGPVDPGFGVPGWPAHPIAPGGPPPVVGGGPIYPGATPTPPIYYPPGIWPSPGHPAHPIAPGGPPYPVDPGFGVPGWPAHPIAPGGPPPVVGGGPIYPGATPTPPIYYPPVGVMPPIFYPPYPSTGPGFPTHPIAPGGPPPGIWGGAPIPGYPAHPIAPGGPPSFGHPEHPINEPPTGGANWVLVFIPGVGWVWAIVPGAGGAPEPPDEGDKPQVDPRDKRD